MRVGFATDALVAPTPSLQSRSLEWAYKCGLVPNQNAYKKAADIRVDDLARRTYPMANQMVLQVCTDLLLWFFIADDQFDERSVGASPGRMEAVSNNFIDILQSGCPYFAASPLDWALLDLGGWLARHSQPSWMPRFIANMRLYLDGCLSEARNRANGHHPGFEEYRDIRRASVGTYPCFDVIELTLSGTISEEIILDPRMAEIRHIATDLIAWINDVVSFQKESAYDDPHNVISVLMNESGMSLTDATAKTIELYEQNLRVFLRQSADLRKVFPDPVVAQYLSGIESWIRGCHTWSFRSKRYGKEYVLLSKQSSHELLQKPKATAAPIRR